MLELEGMSSTTAETVKLVLPRIIFSPSTSVFPNSFMANDLEKTTDLLSEKGSILWPVITFKLAILKNLLVVEIIPDSLTEAWLDGCFTNIR